MRAQESDEDEFEDADDSGEGEGHEDIPDEDHSEQPLEMLVYALPVQPRGIDQTVVDRTDFAPSKVKPLVSHYMAHGT
jgi:hypothetical protein